MSTTVDALTFATEVMALGPMQAVDVQWIGLPAGPDMKPVTREVTFVYRCAQRMINGFIQPNCVRIRRSKLRPDRIICAACHRNATAHT